MKITTNYRRHQQGAVAIIVGLSLFILIGLLGLVLDLGHLYIAKTGLQNAADAAALSGAKELNGTAAGVTAAVNKAITTAGQNKYDFTQQVVIDIGDIRVGDTPTNMVAASSVTTNALAAGKTFLEVMIPSGNLRTWFMRAIPAGPENTATYGLAVAGKYEVDITPIAICKIDTDLTDPDSAQLALDLGFKRGVSYNVSDFNPIAPGTMYWIDPESATLGTCPVTSTNETLPYVCAGKTAFTPIVGQTVNTNTGVSTPQVEALNSRLDEYTPQSKCDPATAPPDTNIKEYIYSDNAPGTPKNWMAPDPTQQTISCIDSPKCKTGVPMPYDKRTFQDYGVLWSAYRPTGATVAQWPTLYKGTVDAALGYPETSPYAQTSGNFFQVPTHTGKPGRRVLNMVIIDCKAAGGVCRPATVLGIGKFFMQRKTNGPKGIYVEFGGLLTQFPPSDIKLYR